jgi:UDP-N-acetyl-D-galactosamine dehydrogenase
MRTHKDRTVAHARKIAVGLGYVGLPVGFARTGASVVRFNIDPQRVAEIAAGENRTREVAADDLRRADVRWTADPRELRAADFFIVTLQPIDGQLRPDLAALLKASEPVDGALKRDDIVVYESTIKPGATEEECLPVLETISGLAAGYECYNLQRARVAYPAHARREYGIDMARDGKGVVIDVKARLNCRTVPTYVELRRL